MSEVKWIKITTDIFDDEKILLIESLPEADSIIVIWFKLLCLAGKMNNSGVFMMSNRIAYTDKMLATIFRRKEATVQLALRTFEEFGMVELIDGVITIPNWGKHQSLERIEANKAYQREYHREYRAKQKQLADAAGNSEEAEEAEDTDDKSLRKYLRKDLRKSNVNALDKNKSKNIDENRLEEEQKLTLLTQRSSPGGERTGSDEAESKPKSVRQIVMDAWNQIGVNPITRIVDGTQRHVLLKRRVDDYGLDNVLKAIGNVKTSDFLMGRTKDSFNITFDWFIRPNNFPKVLDGNYNHTNGENSQPKSAKAQELEDFYRMAADWAQKEEEA